jgi:tryptophan synthase beta chain
MEAAAYTQNAIFEAATLFSSAQGIVPGPEPAHAIKGVIDEALAAREAGQERVILFNLSGHGHFDMQAYDDYLNGRLPEVEFREEDVAVSMRNVPDIPLG